MIVYRCQFRRCTQQLSLFTSTLYKVFRWFVSWFTSFQDSTLTRTAYEPHSRRNFCEWVEGNIIDLKFHFEIHLNEAHFNLNRYVNKTNCCIWSGHLVDLTPLSRKAYQGILTISGSLVKLLLSKPSQVVDVTIRFSWLLTSRQAQETGLPLPLWVEANVIWNFGKCSIAVRTGDVLLR